MLVSRLDKQYYCPRVYVVAETDHMSAKRALTREQEWAAAAAGQVRHVLGVAVAQGWVLHTVSPACGIHWKQQQQQQLGKTLSCSACRSEGLCDALG